MRGRRTAPRRMAPVLGVVIREDLYAGQPCGHHDEPYVLRAPIGYSECVRG